MLSGVTPFRFGRDACVDLPNTPPEMSNGELAVAYKLDSAFYETLQLIEDRYTKLPKHLRLRVELWAQKLSEPCEVIAWKKSRNVYARLLLEAVSRGVLEEPFDKLPPSTQLPQAPVHLMSRFRPVSRTSPPKADTSARSLRARAADGGRPGRSPSKSSPPRRAALGSPPRRPAPVTPPRETRRALGEAPRSPLGTSAAMASLRSSVEAERAAVGEVAAQLEAARADKADLERRLARALEEAREWRRTAVRLQEELAAARPEADGRGRLAEGPTRRSPSPPRPRPRSGDGLDDRSRLGSARALPLPPPEAPPPPPPRASRLPSPDRALALRAQRCAPPAAAAGRDGAQHRGGGAGGGPLALRPLPARVARPPRRPRPLPAPPHPPLRRHPPPLVRLPRHPPLALRLPAPPPPARALQPRPGGCPRLVRVELGRLARRRRDRAAHRARPGALRAAPPRRPPPPALLRAGPAAAGRGWAGAAADAGRGRAGVPGGPGGHGPGPQRQRPLRRQPPGVPLEAPLPLQPRRPRLARPAAAARTQASCWMRRELKLEEQRRVRGGRAEVEGAGTARTGGASRLRGRGG